MAERPHDEGIWPSWAAWVSASFALAITALTPFAHRESAVAAGELVLIALAVTPWMVEALGRQLPRPVFAAGVLVPLAILNIGGGELGLITDHDAQLSLMLVVLAAGQLAARSAPRTATVYALLALLIPVGRFGLEPGFDEWIFWAAGIFLAAGAGMVLRRMHMLLMQLRAAQHALADDAALAERRRIAREIHDVIAHSLAVSMLHVTAARLAVRRDPNEAEEALAEAENLGRQALNDVRRTVGLLHEEAGDATAAPMPSAVDIPDLVEAYADAGLAVRLDCTAELAVLTPAGGLTLYRAVQEGLSNAVKHAPGAAVTVSLRHDGPQVVAEIHNAAPSTPLHSDSAPGLGLRGMRERVEALGGSVTAGPQPGGWVTSCAIPVRAGT